MDERQIFVGKKPVHLYVRAVVMAMESGDRVVRLTARGSAIGNAVDTAELCRRRHGTIAAGLPETVHVRSVDIATEMTERRDGGGERGVSVIHIVLEGEVWDEDGTYPTGSLVWMNRETTHTPKTRGKTLILVLWPEGVKSA